MPLYLRNRQNVWRINRGKLRRRVLKILKTLDLAEAELSLLLVDDQGIRELNRDYRGLDRPTNVLSFAQEEEEEEESPLRSGDAPRLLGDLVLSTETIEREAGPFGYTPAEMFYFYLIHGLLHLLGYDHEQGSEAAAAQEAETIRLWRLIDYKL